MNSSSAHHNSFADEGFWTTTYAQTFSAARFAAAPGQVEQILAVTNTCSDAVLDLACGPGRQAIPLIQRGFNVTGLMCDAAGGPTPTSGIAHSSGLARLSSSLPLREGNLRVHGAFGAA